MKPLILNCVLFYFFIAGSSADHSIDDYKHPKWAFRPKHKVPEEFGQMIAEKAKNFQYRDRIQDLVDEVSEDNIRAYATYITGVTSNHLTRHARSGEPYQAAAEYIQGVFSSFGFNCRQESFDQPGYGPNILCDLQGSGSGSQVIILSAHLDDRIADINDTTSDAPGGNDNASGVVALLEIGRVIQRMSARFLMNVRVCIWGGEEQGLLGSRYYAQEMRDQDANISAVLNADMIGYKDPEQPIPRLDFALRFSDPNLTGFAPIFIQPYVPPNLLTIGTGHDGCCSDHQSFFEQGYPAISFTEGFGYVLDPAYHTPEDIVDRPDWSGEQIARISQAMIAVLGTLATVA